MYKSDNQVADSGHANEHPSDIQPSLIHSVLLHCNDEITRIHSVSFMLMMNHEEAYMNWEDTWIRYNDSLVVKIPHQRNKSVSSMEAKRPFNI